MTAATAETPTDPFLSEEFHTDPNAVIARVRAEDPVHLIPGLDAWMVTRYDDVREMFTHPDATNDRREHDSDDRFARNDFDKQIIQIRNERIERVAHRVLQQHPCLGHTFGAGGQDVGPVQFIQQVGSDFPDYFRGSGGAQNNGGNP